MNIADLPIINPWRQGVMARQQGKQRHENPFTGDERACHAGHEDKWDDGWLFAGAEITRAEAKVHEIKYVQKWEPRR